MGLLRALGDVCIPKRSHQPSESLCKADCGLTVVSKGRVEDGSKHEGLVEELVDAVLVGLDTDDTVLGEGASSISEKTDGLKQVLDENRLKDVEL